MAKTRVFLSYSHQNTATRLALVGALSSSFDIKWDGGATHTAELHKDISANLNWCDVVVPIVTADWLASHECRDEMVRANERRKTIIPFRHVSVSDDGPPKVPWFLRDTLYIVWDEGQIQRAIDDLVAALRNLSIETWRGQSYRALRHIGDDIQKTEKSVPWRNELCQQILSITKHQLHQILVTDLCTFDVSHEHTYLRFAEPIFGQAKSIVAICIASISTFWTNPDFRNASSQYLINQRKSAESICRLFVFDSVAEVMHFRAILQKHHDAYGESVDRSGVFVCSTSSYRWLLSRWSRTTDGNELRQDFGLLSFADTTQIMHATLNQSEFRYELYDEDDVAQAEKRLVIEHFDQMKSLGLGAFDPQSGVARWSPEWSVSDEQLEEALERLFKDRQHTITHVVLLKARSDGPEIRRFLHQLVSRFHKQRNILHLRSIAASRRCDLVVIDGRYTAPLRLSVDFDYVLSMEFESEDDLRHYYQHELHSIEREHLYALLNPEVKAEFDSAARLDRSQVDQRSAIFSRIEKGMTDGGFIRRIDVRDDEPLAGLISRLQKLATS